MFNIAHTFYEEIVTEIIQHALKQRHGTDSIKADREAIMMSEHWKNELATLPISASVSIVDLFILILCLEKRKNGRAAQTEVEDCGQAETQNEI